MIRTIAVLVAALLPAGMALADVCEPGRVDFRPAGAPSGTVRFGVEIADTAAERAVGLMHRKHMGASQGMLFVYDRPQEVRFWMENTLIPLDMIFLGEDGVVRHVHENAVPLDRTGIPGGADIEYVLEINGGLARRLGIAEGSEMRSPLVDQDHAAWRCDAGG